jgi:hypothetical protein
VSRPKKTPPVVEKPERTINLMGLNQWDEAKLFAILKSKGWPQVVLTVESLIKWSEQQDDLSSVAKAFTNRLIGVLKESRK